MSDAITDKALVVSLQKEIDELQVRLVLKMPPYSPKPGEKLRRLSLVWREALLHRIVDLSSAALQMFQQGRLVPGCTLTRSVYETVAQLYCFHKKIVTAVEKKNLKEISEQVDKGAWGSKDGSTEVTATNVLTAISHLNKEFKGSEGEYFHLCEYAHPNMKGVLGSYTCFDLPAYNVTFGVNPQRLPVETFGLGGLKLALLVAKELIERHQKIEPLFNEVIERNAGAFAD